MKNFKCVIDKQAWLISQVVQSRLNGNGFTTCLVLDVKAPVCGIWEHEDTRMNILYLFVLFRFNRYNARMENVQRWLLCFTVINAITSIMLYESLFSDMTKGLFSTITSVQIFTNDRFSVSPHRSSRHVQFCKERTKWA